MIAEPTIYEWANRDVRTGSIPSRNQDGSFELSNGMRKILNFSCYSFIPNTNLELQRLKQEQSDLFKQMLHQQTVYEKSKLAECYLKDKEIELVRESADLDILQGDILREKELLVNRGYQPPEEPKRGIPRLATSTSGRKTRINSRDLKKWGVVFLSIVILEGFFGLALWDSLRDQKSIIQVILRIAASGILVVTLHIAEYRYKNLKKGIYAGYIMYGIVTLTTILIGSLVLGYFFPEYLEGNVGFDANVFDLNLDETSINTAAPRSVIGFYIRYDFILGIIAVIIFMLISFLETGKRKNKSSVENSLVNKVKVNINPAFIQLLNLYEKEFAQIEKVNNLKIEIQKLKAEPNYLSVEVLDLLKMHKQKIEELKLQISNKRNSLEQRFNQLEEQLNQYKVDFKDVYCSLPTAYLFNPVWPDRKDINQYYNIK
ncbi:MAG: hypothetical protein M0Q12_07785 [Synergistaceae bacterium]|nr:hypothetical protein [Synergistaceae bacterium]